MNVVPNFFPFHDLITSVASIGARGKSLGACVLVMLVQFALMHGETAPVTAVFKWAAGRRRMLTVCGDAYLTVYVVTLIELGEDLIFILKVNTSTLIYKLCTV